MVINKIQRINIQKIARAKKKGFTRRARTPTGRTKFFLTRKKAEKEVLKRFRRNPKLSKKIKQVKILKLRFSRGKRKGKK
jgi:hypothetical protein